VRKSCDKLSAIGENISEEDRIVYLLAYLSESYSTLVTTLEQVLKSLCWLL